MDKIVSGIECNKQQQKANLHFVQLMHVQHYRKGEKGQASRGSATIEIENVDHATSAALHLRQLVTAPSALQFSLILNVC